MNNYLEKICMNLGIKLVYNYNKVTVLSAEKKNGLMIIRAHRIFKSCPLSVAEAVVSFYTNETYNERSKQILKDYITPHFTTDTFKIKPLDSSYEIDIGKNMPVDLDYNDEDQLLTEYNISSISVKNFWGDEQNQIDNLIRPSSNDILDINIVVMPPK